MSQDENIGSKEILGSIVVASSRAYWIFLPFNNVPTHSYPIFILNCFCLAISDFLGYFSSRVLIFIDLVDNDNLTRELFLYDCCYTIFYFAHQNC